MYGVFTYDCYHQDGQIIAFCRTRFGAKRACKHFRWCYDRENGRNFTEIGYKKINHYRSIRFEYFLLCMKRDMAQAKLRRLETEEYLCRNARESQERKVSALYQR